MARRKVLMAVVHHDGVEAVFVGKLRAGSAVARDDRRRGGRQQQGLVAGFGGAVVRGIDKAGPTHLAAIAA